MPCYFVTKEFWVMNKIVQLCIEFNVAPFQYVFYLTDHWALIYDDLDVAFIQFNVVKSNWRPCNFYLR